MNDARSQIPSVDGRLIRPHALTAGEHAAWALAAADADAAHLTSLRTVSRLRDEKDEALSHVVVLLRMTMQTHDSRRCWCRPFEPKTATCAEGSFIRAAHDLLTRRGLADQL